MLMNSNSTKVVSVKYQVSWPGTDVMNAQNPSQVATRVSYYGVSGVPNAILDGNAFNDQPYLLTWPIFNSETTVPSPFTIQVSHWLNAAQDSVSIRCVVTASQANTMTTPKLRVALIEKVIDFTGQPAPGTNGEMVFEHVMRKMYPNPQGTTLASAWTVGQNTTVSFMVPIPTYVYDIAQLAVVAWVQDDASKNVKQAGYSEFATAPSAQAPIANFVVDEPAPCDGQVRFSDRSAMFPTSWLWDFGDGHTSTAQNPDHTYLTNGNFNVSLTATNANGSDQVVHNAMVQVNLPQASIVGINDSVCGNDIAIVHATANAGGLIRWYDVDGTSLDTGYTLQYPVSGSTTFYATEEIINPVLTLGAPDTSIATGGQFFTSNNTHGLYFDVTHPCSLLSLDVYSGAPGQRTIVMLDPNGSIVHSNTYYFPTGRYTVQMNEHFNVGQGYLIKISSSTVNLFRNVGGATYPYVSDAITITGNTAPTAPNNYYFFYNWHVQRDPCHSLPTPVYAFDSCSVTGAEEPALSNRSVQVFPNPSHGIYQLAFEADHKDNYTISVTNIVGQVVFSQVLNAFQGRYSEPIDLGDASNGIYFLMVSDSRGKVVKKLVKE
jgi:PKD repeat protein